MAIVPQMLCLPTCVPALSRPTSAACPERSPCGRRSQRVSPSSNAQNTYGWLGQFPKLREWVGDRVFRNMKEEGYAHCQQAV